MCITNASNELDHFEFTESSINPAIMVEAPTRRSIKYLEDEGLRMYLKSEEKEAKKKPPKVRKRLLTNIDYLAESGLNCLTPDLSKSFPSSLYDKSIECTYFEQCFTIIDRLGEGSFGFVLKVISKEDKKVYALKLAKEPFRGDQDRSLKLKEVENHSLLSGHSNVVTLYDAWEEDRLLYILMELCKNNLTKTRGMSEADCWEVLVDITLALDLLHENGMGHFDVKLENILRGHDGLYKLSDFGLTFKIDNPIRKHPVEGDAKYLPPELLSSKNKFSEKADIFSLGISVLELAGNLILPSHGEVWKALRNDTFPRAQTQHISDELFLLLTKMMASEYSQRPSTKEILNTPRVRAILTQRKFCTLALPLSFPSDKLHQFVLIWMIFYALVKLVNQQLIKQELETDLMEVENSETEVSKKIEYGEPRMFLSPFFTSTPYENRLRPGYDMSMMSQIVSGVSGTDSPYSSLQMNQSTMEDSSYHTMSISPTQLLMACDISPIKISRDIKSAIRKRRSIKAKLNEKRGNQSVARVLFRDSIEEENEQAKDKTPPNVSNVALIQNQDTSTCFKYIKAKRNERNGSQNVARFLFRDSIEEVNGQAKYESVNNAGNVTQVENQDTPTSSKYFKGNGSQSVARVLFRDSIKEENDQAKSESPHNAGNVTQFENQDTPTSSNYQRTDKLGKKRISQDIARKILFSNNNEEENSRDNHMNISSEQQDTSSKRQRMILEPLSMSFDESEEEY